MWLRADALPERLKKLFSKKGVGFIAIAILSGLLLLILPENGGDNNAESQGNTVYTSADYCALLESKAERLICELPEIDSCTVFITLDCGYKYVYATDQHVREESDFKETEKNIVLAGNGNGEAPILISETMPQVAGVAVVCEDATYETQYRIIELMCALFDIKSNRISVQA